MAFDPTTPLVQQGQTRTDMYHVNDTGMEPLSAEVGPPTWQAITPFTGCLVGTFSLPTGSDAVEPRTININQFACQPEMNYRFSITNDDLVAGQSCTSDKFRRVENQIFMLTLEEGPEYKAFGISIEGSGHDDGLWKHLVLMFSGI